MNRIVATGACFPMLTFSRTFRRSVTAQAAIVGALVVMTLLITGVLGRVAHADPGDRKRVGTAGDWKDTVAAAVLNSRLYTIERGGALYVTEPAMGKWQRVGKTTFPQARFLVAVGRSLYSIHQSGSLYRINPASGAFTRIGPVGGWKDTIQATSMEGQIYTVESSGALYKTDPLTGKWTQVGDTNFAGARLLAGRNKISYLDAGLYLIDPSGTLHDITMSTGGKKRKTELSLKSGNAVGTILQDCIYTVSADGALQLTNLETGETVRLGAAGTYSQTTQLLVSMQDPNRPAIYALDADGSLYAVEMAPLAG